MPRVTVRPAGVELDVLEGESLAEAAWRQNFVWPTKCWGQAECMSCFTTIVEGELDAVPAEDDELDAIRTRMSARFHNDPRVRLGCQLKCRGVGLVVDKPGFRAAEPHDNNADTVNTGSGAQRS